MSDDQHPDEIDSAAQATTGEAVLLAGELGAGEAAVRDHLALLPTRYAAAVSPRAVVRHTLMATPAPATTEVRTRVTPGRESPDGRAGLDELDVVAIDHPGWFAKVAGVVALHGGSIVAADAFTRGDGLAVDTFRVARPRGTGGSWWVRVEGDLAEAAAGRLAIRARVARMARRESGSEIRELAIPTKVAAITDPRGRVTVVEVHTLDRIGVLYAIAAAMAELELDIVVARIQTLGREVVDVFHLRDAEGRPLDSDHVAELELAIAAAVDTLG